MGHLRAGHGASAPSAPRSSGAIGGIAGLTAVATVGLAVSSSSAKAGPRSPWRWAIFWKNEETCGYHHDLTGKSWV